MTYNEDFTELVTLNSRQLPQPSQVTSHQETQEVSLNLANHRPRSQLVTLHRPTPKNMTPREASFHQQSYPHQLPLPMSSRPDDPEPPMQSHRMHSNLQMPPPRETRVPKSPHQLRTMTSLPNGSPTTSKFSPSPIQRKYSPHPFQAPPTSMFVRKPEPISWIKYPVEPHRLYPGPYAAVQVPFEDMNNNGSSEAPLGSRKGKLSLTWSPQKVKYPPRSGKCVRFACTWGPRHAGSLGQYATINPKNLTSRYVRPAVFRRSNLKE